MDDQILSYLESCDEIWHGGDFGTIAVVKPLLSLGKPLRGVYGNIDGADIRSEFPENLVFELEGVKVLMRHIGGYPPRYNPDTKKLLKEHQPKIFIAGHSHILKIIHDPVIDCLHLNPGAAGHQGWHTLRTMIRFSIDAGNIKDAEVIELGRRGRGIIN